MENPISIIFDGKRFDNHTIPLSMLSDLSTIDKMVTDVASHIYLKKNPERERVPRGFRDNVFLSLRGVENGSASASLEIVRLRPQTTLIPSQEEECMLEAFEIIRDFVAGDLQERHKVFEKIISSHFKTIGRGLKPEESLSFKYKTKTSTLDNGTRHRLTTKMPEYVEDVEIYGIIDAVDRHFDTFKIEYGNPTRSLRVECRLDKRILLDVKRAFDEYDSGRKVYIRGEGLFKDQKLQKVENTEEFQLLDQLDIAYRLNELQYIEDGWMEDGSGLALDRNSLIKLSKLFDEYYWSDTVLPHIFPTPEGNIEMEWTLNGHELVLKIDLTTFKAEMIDIENETRTELDLNSDLGWKGLNDLLKEMSGK